MTFLCRACEAQQSHEMYHNIMKFKKKIQFHEQFSVEDFYFTASGQLFSSEDDNGAFVHRKERLLPLKNGKEKAVKKTFFSLKAVKKNMFFHSKQ